MWPQGPDAGGMEVGAEKGVSEEGVSEGNTSMEEKCRCLQVPCWSDLGRSKPSQLLKGRIFFKEIIFIPPSMSLESEN